MIYDHGPILLSEYGSAVILTEMEFKDKEFVEPYKSMIFTKNPDGTTTFKRNPDYPYKTRAEEKEAMEIHMKKRNEFIYNKLKENYSEYDYAERFKESEMK